MSDDQIKPDPDKKPKRPRDANQLAKFVVDLATGEAEEVKPDPSKVEAGEKGGRARAKNLTDQEKSEIAKRAAAARWRSA